MSRDPRSSTDDPTAERTTDTSTQSASGLGTPRPDPDAERDRAAEEPVNRDPKAHVPTPRRYEQSADEDPVMPTDDATLGTKI